MTTESVGQPETPIASDTVPNPGSNVAVLAGCKCPVMDNAHGKGHLCQPGVFWIADDCPLHGEK